MKRSRKYVKETKKNKKIKVDKEGISESEVEGNKGESREGRLDKFRFCA
jgi:hypothetical protein